MNMANVRSTNEDRSRSAQTVVLMALAMASEYSHEGRFSDAEDVLQDLLKSGVESAEAYDLLARICAQVGRYEMSIEMWQKALNIDPTNQIFKQALNNVKQVQKRSGFPKLLIVSLSVVISIAVSLLYFLRHDGAFSVTTKTQVTEQRRLLDFVGAVNANGKKLGDLMFDVPHLSKVMNGDRLILNFDEGLFASGVVLKIGSRDLLMQLARQLQKHPGQLDIIVVGATDDLPIREDVKSLYQDNYALGLARAVVATECMRSAMNSLDIHFSLESSGYGNAPYSNDLLNNSVKNRTATFVVTEKKGAS